MLTVVADGCPGDGGVAAGPVSLIDEIVREGARRMLAEALRAEVDAYIAEFSAERGEDGRRLVVRNGYHEPREVLTSAGAVTVTAPRVNDKRADPATGERRRFSSAILPPWCRKTPRVTQVLPLLYLHGLSSGDFVPAGLVRRGDTPRRAAVRDLPEGTGRGGGRPMNGYVRWDRAAYIDRVGLVEEAERRRKALMARQSGYRLAEERKRRGLTQAQVAAAMGVTPGRVCQIERGELATIDAVARYVEAFGGRLDLIASFGDRTLTVSTTEAA